MGSLRSGDRREAARTVGWSDANACLSSSLNNESDVTQGVRPFDLALALKVKLEQTER
jgi:hypothetical protein